MSRAALPFSRPSWARQRSAPRSAAQSSSSSKSSRRSRTMFSTRAGLASMVIDGLQKRKTRLTGGFGTVGWGCGSDGQAGAPAGGLVDGEHVLVLDEAGPADLWDVVFPSARDARGDLVGLAGPDRRWLRPARCSGRRWQGWPGAWRDRGLSRT